MTLDCGRQRPGLLNHRQATLAAMLITERRQSGRRCNYRLPQLFNSAPCPLFFRFDANSATAVGGTARIWVAPDRQRQPASLSSDADMPVEVIWPANGGRNQRAASWRAAWSAMTRRRSPHYACATVHVMSSHSAKARRIGDSEIGAFTAVDNDLQRHPSSHD